MVPVEDASSTTAPFAPELLLAMQQSAGNTAVGRLMGHAPAGLQRQTSTVQRPVFETNLPGGGKVDELPEGGFLFWNFDIGKFKLKAGHNAAIPRIVERVLSAIKTDDTVGVDIEGEASRTGSGRQNEALGQKRAEEVKQALMAAGVDPKRIRQTSVGSLKSQPATTQKRLAKSRAVRVVLAQAKIGPALARPASAPGRCRLQVPLDLEGGDIHVLDEVDPDTGLRLRVLRAGNGTFAGAGMMIIASPLVPAACRSKTRGTTAFIQNVQPFREIVYKDGSRNTMQTSAWHLDNPSRSKQMQNVALVDDSPGLGVSVKRVPDIATMEIRDHYRMFFVHQTPQGNHTLEVAEWAVAALAKNTQPGSPEGQLEKDTSVSRVIPKAGLGRRTSEAPVLSPPVGSLHFVSDTGGLRKAIAVEHALILNRGRP